MKPKVLLLLIFALFSFDTHAQQIIEFFDSSKMQRKGRLKKEAGISSIAYKVSSLKKSQIVNQLKNSKIGFSLSPKNHIAVDFEIDTKLSYKNYSVYLGRTENSQFKHLNHYHDAVVVLNKTSGEITAQFNTSKGAFEITPLDSHDGYQILEFEKDEWECRAMELKSQTFSNNSSSGCDEKDSNGTYVADLFVGYSYAAAAQVTDIDAHALSLVAMVNNGLSNSLVDNIYVRLVGTGLSEHNPGVITSVLGDVYDWFEDEIASTGADYVASIQKPTGARNEAGGWAGVGGYSSVNSINNAANVFRHELGHNIGSSHCTPGILPYASGYNNGNVKTHMCGNNVNFYSTPLVFDDMGLPLGDSLTADNARVWKERAPVVTKRRIHTIKFDNNDQGCNDVLPNGTYQVRHLKSNKYLGPLNGSVSRGTKVVLADSSVATHWTLRALGNGTYQFINSAGNKSLNIPGSSRSSGTNVIIWSIGTSDNQKFDIREVSADTFRIKAFNGFCLQTENDTDTLKTHIEQNLCSDALNNLWQFIPVASSATFNITVNTQDILCKGDTTGSAQVVAKGGSGNYSYSWSSGDTTNQANNLAAGQHTVTVNDGFTSITYEFQITQAPPINVTLDILNANTSVQGTATLTSLGGTAPYTITWSNGVTSLNTASFNAGLHHVIVSDATGCKVKKEFYVACSDAFSLCDDGNPNTRGDYIDENCNCVGVPISCPGEKYNLALKRKAKQSSTHSIAEADRAVDGNTNGDYARGSVAHTEKSLNPWWGVDLGTVRAIDKVLIWNRTDCCEGRLDDVHLFISKTPFTSEDPSVIQSDTSIYQMQLVGRKVPYELAILNTEGRYLRIQSARNDEHQLNIAEVEVFSCNNPIIDNITSNTIDGDSLEFNGFLIPLLNTVDSVEFHYYTDETHYRVKLDSCTIELADTTWLSHSIQKGMNPSYNYFFKVFSNGKSFESPLKEDSVVNNYCTPEVGTSLWYKTFRETTINGSTYTHNGNAYTDNSSTFLGEFKLDSTYSVTLKTPSSSWTNLYYNIYIDLNNDYKFDERLELVGTSTPKGQFTEVGFTIPSVNVAVDKILRMRIQGHEGGIVTPCYAPLGNTVDYSLKLVGIPLNGVIGSGSLLGKNLVLEDLNLSTRTYKAQNTIQLGANAQNPSGQRTKLSTQKSINIIAGTTIEAGSVFEAVIEEGCSNN